jgi:hypothetical protein
MAYRNPLTAARAKALVARERVDERFERVTDELLARLPTALAGELSSFRRLFTHEPTTLEGWQKYAVDLGDYARLLEQAIERAPRLERGYNRLPRSFPKRLKCRHEYRFPDAYNKLNQRVRAAIRKNVRSLDAEAELLDEGKRYYDRVVNPYLVEALFRFERAPLRFYAQVEIIALGLGTSTTDVYYSLMTRTRASTPEFEITPETFWKRVDKFFGVQRDAQVGRAKFDQTFVVDAGEDVLRLLTADVCEALMAIGTKRSPTLVVANGTAHLSWHEKNAIHRGLEPAAHALAALRAAPPVKLLRKPKK